jgi:hypothetical protein
MLPQSCTLAHAVVLESRYPVSRSALSDVFRGESAGAAVAVKSLRIHADNLDAVKKVILSRAWLSLGLRWIAVVQKRSDYLEVPETSKHRAVPRDLGRH